MVGDEVNSKQETVKSQQQSTRKPVKIAARDDLRKLVLLLAIQQIPRPNERDLILATGIPRRSIHSLLRVLNRECVTINRVNGRRHGYYEIADSCVYNLDRIPEVIEFNYPDVLQQILSFVCYKSQRVKSDPSVSNGPNATNVKEIYYGDPVKTDRTLQIAS